MTNDNWGVLCTLILDYMHHQLVYNPAQMRQNSTARCLYAKLVNEYTLKAIRIDCVYS